METVPIDQAPVTFTAPAVERFRELLSREDRGPGQGIRLSIRKGGCSGYEYEMSSEAGPHEGDLVVEEDGVRVFIDPEAVPILEGTTVDYTVSLTKEGFRFVNPKATRTCGCGESFGV